MANIKEIKKIKKNNIYSLSRAPVLTGKRIFFFHGQTLRPTIILPGYCVSIA